MPRHHFLQKQKIKNTALQAITRRPRKKNISFENQLVEMLYKKSLVAWFVPRGMNFKLTKYFLKIKIQSKKSFGF